MIGSIISGALGFLGASKSNKEARKQAAIDRYNNSPAGIRANAEAAGFNPLTVLNSGRSFGAGYQPVFANALGELGRGIEDFVSGREAVKMQKAELELERKRVDALIKATTLGPPNPGIYGRTTGAKGSNYANDNSNTASAGARNSRLVNVDGNSGGTSAVSIPSDSAIDPSRKFERSPVVSGAGITEIDNRFTNGPIYVPGDDGEPWGFDEVMTAFMFGLPQMAAPIADGMSAGSGAMNKPKISAKEAEKIRKERKRDKSADPWWNIQLFD